MLCLAGAFPVDCSQWESVSSPLNLPTRICICSIGKHMQEEL